MSPFLHRSVSLSVCPPFDARRPPLTLSLRRRAGRLLAEPLRSCIYHRRLLPKRELRARPRSHVRAQTRGVRSLTT